MASGGTASAAEKPFKLGGKHCMTEFQGALLMAQMTRIEQQSRTREENAQYLTGLLKEIPGIQPSTMYAGCTRNNYHLYMLRYQAEQFANLPRTKFLEALNAEGIPSFGGYATTDWAKFTTEALSLRGYQRVYSKEMIAEWNKRCRIPENDRLCREAVWLTQPMLLGPRSDMDEIAAAIRKIHAHAGELAKA